jgi:hypothetical protein
MVFIGLSSEMDEKAITARLNACLVDNYLSDEASFKGDNDPFPLWFQDVS